MEDRRGHENNFCSQNQHFKFVVPFQNIFHNWCNFFCLVVFGEMQLDFLVKQKNTNSVSISSHGGLWNQYQNSLLFVLFELP